MSVNLLPAVICLVFAVALVPWVRRLPQRIREHDAIARANRRRREIDEAKWRELERRAEFRAGLHSKLTGRA